MHTDFVTPEEYLEMEAAAETKHEYIDGVIYAMSPGVSPEHNLITINLIGALKNKLRGRSCTLHSADVRVRVSRTRHFYPDLSVVCGKPEFEKYKGVDMLLNPIVIFEVLSPSTENYDLAKKFKMYRGLGSMQQYVCVSQSEISVINHVCREGQWWLSDVSDVLPLPSIDCTLTLGEIYEEIEFPPEPESSEA